MKIVVALTALTLGLSACASATVQDSQESAFTEANYAAVDRVVAAPNVPIDRNTPVLVATVVSVDNLRESSRLGRLISEQVAARLTQLGYYVIEMKLRNNIYIQEGMGELLLSRDVRDLSKSYNAQVVIVGSYAVASSQIYLTLKAVTVIDNRTVAATNYLLPLTANNKALLASRADGF